MAKVRLVHEDGSRSYGIVLVPDKHVPKILKQGERLYVFAYTQGERLVFKETEVLDALTEAEFEGVKQAGLIT